jgi:uncharacterized protein
MHWLNEPPSWQTEGDTITVKAGPQTDFWRRTHDNGRRDSGHFLYEQITGDFTAQVKVSGDYVGLYDHAGLMVRLSETVWLKCGVEFVEGVQYASAVITHDWSDWSIRPLDNPPSIWLKVVRHGGSVEVYFSTDGVKFDMIRQGYLTEEPTVGVGMMFAAPKGDGFTVRFDDFTVTP